jgi:hypothetical protein
MDAKRSAAVPLSSPTAGQRCAGGVGLDSGAGAATQSVMPSIAAHSRTNYKQRFHQRRRIYAASAPVSTSLADVTPSWGVVTVTSALISFSSSPIATFHAPSNIHDTEPLISLS